MTLGNFSTRDSVRANPAEAHPAEASAVTGAELGGPVACPQNLDGKHYVVDLFTELLSPPADVVQTHGSWARDATPPASSASSSRAIKGPHFLTSTPALAFVAVEESTLMISSP